MPHPGPAARGQVARWIRTSLQAGIAVSFGWRHADEEMRKDGVTRADVLFALKNCRVLETQGRSTRSNGWRYKTQGKALDSSDIAVVVEIEYQPEKLTVVTVWRIKNS